MASFKFYSVLGAFTCFLVSLSIAVKLPANSDPNPAPLSWWQEDIIYQVYPRSHQDSDDDGVGDLKGIMNRLDHFVDIGVKAVWLSPIYKSPMKDFGYDISDFKDIDPAFGTMQDFDSLAAEMKAKGIRLVMDFVPNHSSDEHEWFEKSINREGKYADYYVWKDPASRNATGHPLPPNNWNSVFGGSAWEWNEVRGQFYLHQFTIGQPDLNFENHDVIVEMLSILKFWMDKGVDGFRMDAVPHMFEDQRFLNEPLNPNRGPDTRPTDHSYLSHVYTYDLPGGYDVLAEMRNLIDIYSLTDGIERVMMVEATNPTLKSLFKWYGTKEKPIAHFPFNFEFINKVRVGPNGGNSIASVVDEWFCQMPEGYWANWLMGNHDNKRIASRFGPAVVDAFNMLTLLLPGNAVTYYGEEIGMADAQISWEDTVDPPACAAGPDRYQSMSRDPERTPMQWNGRDKNAGFSNATKTWLPMHSNWTIVNVENQRNSAGLSHLKVYKEVAKLRYTPVWRWGSTEAKSLKSGAMFGLARIYNGAGFVFLANFGNEMSVDLPLEFEGIPDKAKVYMTSVDYKPDTITVNADVWTNNLVVGSNHSIVIMFPTEENPPNTTEEPPETTTDPPEATKDPADDSASGIFSSVQITAILLVSLIFHLQLQQ